MQLRDLISSAIECAVADGVEQGYDPALNIKTDDKTYLRIYTRISRDPSQNRNGGDYDYWMEFEIVDGKLHVFDDWSAEFDRNNWLHSEDFWFPPLVDTESFMREVADTARWFLNANTQ